MYMVIAIIWRPLNLRMVIVNHDSYGIRLTDTADGRNSASMLINKMYAWRGYGSTHQFNDDPNRITLTATDKGSVVGTLSIGIDSPIGLMADLIFKEELDLHRKRGARLRDHQAGVRPGGAFQGVAGQPVPPGRHLCT